MGWPTKHVYMNVADKHAIQRTVSADQHREGLFSLPLHEY